MMGAQLSINTEREPQVSVVMACYNAAALIGQSIASVQAQTFTDWELLVIDDASHDNSVPLVQALATADPRIRLVRNEANSGPARTRNAGIRLARGRYISFLDSDDLWDPTFLARMTAFASVDGKAFIFSSYRIVSADGTVVVGENHAPARATYRDLLHGNCIGCLATMFDTRQVGRPEMEPVGHEDYTLWLKILKNGFVAQGLDEVLASYRLTANSISRNKLRAAGFQWKVYRHIEKFSLPVSLWYFLHYAWRGFHKGRKKNPPV